MKTGWIIIAAALVGGTVLAGDVRAAATRIGDFVTEFTVKDHAGKVWKLSDLKGKVVVLEWTDPTCSYVKRHYARKTFEKLHDKYADKEVVYLAVNSTGAKDEKVKQFVEAEKVKYPVLVDDKRVVAKIFEPKTTPHMFVIDKEGKLAYSGAIDNDAQGDKSVRINYVEDAVDELLTGLLKVRVAETKPYGCAISK